MRHLRATWACVETTRHDQILTQRLLIEADGLITRSPASRARRAHVILIYFVVILIGSDRLLLVLPVWVGASCRRAWVAT